MIKPEIKPEEKHPMAVGSGLNTIQAVPNGNDTCSLLVPVA
jgi:hypothetical protein